MFSNNTDVLNSTGNQEPPFDLVLNKVEKLTLFVFFILTLIGNLSVIVILLVCKKQRNKKTVNLRSVSRMSFYIICLSAADINVAILSILPELFWRYSISFPVNSQFLCKFTRFSQVFCIYTSTFILVTMAYDRYKCICKPMQSYIWTFKSATISINIALLLAFIISLPQAVLYSYQKVPNYNMSTCYVDWASKNLEKSYAIFHTFSQFIIPLLLLAYFYINIFSTVSKNVNYKSASLKHDKDDTSHEYSEVNENCCLNKLKQCFPFNKLMSQSSSKGSYELNVNINENKIFIEPILKQKNSNKSNRKRSNMMPMRQNWSVEALSRSKLKTLKLTLTVVIAYIICSSPFYIGLIIHVFLSSENYAQEHGKLMHYFLIISMLLFQSNSCVNPFIYMFFNGNAITIIQRYFKCTGKRNYADDASDTIPTSNLGLRKDISNLSKTKITSVMSSTT